MELYVLSHSIKTGKKPYSVYICLRLNKQ